MPLNARADASLPTQQNDALITAATSSSFIEKKAQSTRSFSSTSNRIAAAGGVIRHSRASSSKRMPATPALRSLPTSVIRIVSQPSPPKSGSRASSSANALAAAKAGSRSRSSAASSPPSRARARQDRRELRPRRDVRIRIAGDDCAAAGAIEHWERAVHLAPVAFARGFVVRTLHRDAGRFADGQRFRDGVLELVTFVAYVRDVARGAGRARGFGARDQLAAIGVTSRFVDEPARTPERAFVDRFANQPRLRALRRPRAARRVACDAPARRPQADQRRDVEGDALLLDECEELIERRPRDLEVIPSGIARFGSSAAPCSGPTEVPQLPPISVVTPCAIFPSQRPSTSQSSSECE